MAEKKKKGCFTIILVLLAIGWLVQACEGDGPSSMEQANEMVVGTWEISMSGIHYLYVVKEDGSFEKYMESLESGKSNVYKLDKKGEWTIKKNQYIDSRELYFEISFGRERWVIRSKKALYQSGSGFYRTLDRKSKKQEI